MTKTAPELAGRSIPPLAEVEQRVLRAEVAIARQNRFIETLEHFGPFHALDEACLRLETFQSDLAAHRATLRMLREPQGNRL